MKFFGPGGAKFAFPAVLVILELYLLVNGQLLFKESWGVWSNVITIYLFMTIAATALLIKEQGPPAIRVILLGGLFFFLFSIVFALAFIYTGVPFKLSVPTGALLPTLTLNLVIAGSEEFFFRGYLQTKLGGIGGLVLSAGGFAIFHAYAYSSLGFDPLQLIVPFIAGLVLGFLYIRTKAFAGLGVVIAAHLAYNAALLGINPLAGLV